MGTEDGARHRKGEAVMIAKAIFQENDKARALLALAISATLFFVCLTGCSAPSSSTNISEEENIGATSDSSATDKKDTQALLQSADLQGSVANFDAKSLTIRPVQGDDETAVQPLQDVGTDETVSFADNVRVSTVTYDPDTRASQEAPSSLEDIKLDSSVFVWLDDAGAVSRVVLFRMA